MDNQNYMPLLAQLAADAPDKQVNYTPLTNPGNKGLVRSALQKYIRRGRYEDAIRMASYMKGPDTKAVQYLWFSLQTVSIEDVSIGSPIGVAAALLGGLVGVRASFPGDQLLSGVIKTLCLAPKSRICAEISLHGDYHSLDRFATFAGLSSDDLAYKFLGSDGSSQGTQDSYIAHCVLRGQAPRIVSKRKPLDRMTIDILAGQMVEPGFLRDATMDPLSYVESWAAAVCLDRGTDTMHGAFYPALRDVGSMVEFKEEFPEETVIRSVSSVAFDKHTGPGRLAMKAFYTSLKKDYPTIARIDEDKAIRAIGNMVFCVEGALVDRRLGRTAKSDAWRRMHDVAFCVGEGVPLDDFEECTAIVAKEIPRLNQKRLWAATLNG